MSKLKDSANQLKTIFALASASGKAGVAVVRVSGPAVSHVYSSITKYNTLPKERVMVNRSILHPTTKQLIDRALLVYFQRASYLHQPLLSTQNTQNHAHSLLKIPLSCICMAVTQSLVLLSKHSLPSKVADQLNVVNSLDAHSSQTSSISLRSKD